ncbi:hypothetical protein [Deinococcus peraridilitoris]|uniref:Uncharacterized protein n=1 Tax=Deinococcus peraridilitoris (strain DSM 19664 / LMG 22246 / CIP 109416 / KR-200) TaxID=937777 RepID=K9ZX31_DEIPD|nr:hypothetical protein [Deinococcus peraridilitoris]AFZ66203.1 hypothetical protein Deipe_0613 [Deinococcus peraridilitoris DSM 19664]
MPIRVHFADGLQQDFAEELETELVSVIPPSGSFDHDGNLVGGASPTEIHTPLSTAQAVGRFLERLTHDGFIAVSGSKFYTPQAVIAVEIVLPESSEERALTAERPLNGVAGESRL